jgi:hypothetical protein
MSRAASETVPEHVRLLLHAGGPIRRGPLTRAVFALAKSCEYRYRSMHDGRSVDQTVPCDVSEAKSRFDEHKRAVMEKRSATAYAFTISTQWGVENFLLDVPRY